MLSIKFLLLSRYHGKLLILFDSWFVPHFLLFWLCGSCEVPVSLVFFINRNHITVIMPTFHHIDLSVFL